MGTSILEKNCAQTLSDGVNSERFKVCKVKIMSDWSNDEDTMMKEILNWMGNEMDTIAKRDIEQEARRRGLGTRITSMTIGVSPGFSAVS